MLCLGYVYAALQCHHWDLRPMMNINKEDINKEDILKPFMAVKQRILQCMKFF